MSAKGKKTDTAPLVLPVKFSPLVEAIRDILRTHWPEICADELLQKIFPDKPMIAKRRNKTLANILVRSKIIGNEPNRPLANSRPPRSDPLPTVTPNVLQLFSKRKPMSRCGRRTCIVCTRGY